MTHFSPAIFGMWSVCSVLFTTFCIYHLWHYDRFHCLRMNQGPYPGAFKRVMTYTFLLTPPLMTVYSVGSAVIKYNEGFIPDPQYGVIPKPYTEWTKAHQDAAIPLLVLFAVCFSLDVVTHLEELCFWMFLMNATTASQNWFRSIYFLVWFCGSVIAIIVVPTVSMVFRDDPLKSEAYTFLVGGSASFALALFFIPVLYSFPAFLHKLVQQGIDRSTVIRLQKFHQLNRLRFIFKLLFLVPVLLIGTDGVIPYGHLINESMFWTDILGMSVAFGCTISATITLLIFFPRNDENEYETSSLARFGPRKASRENTKIWHPRGKDTFDCYRERNCFMFPSDASIGSSPAPPGHAPYSKNLASGPQEGGYGPPPRYQAPNVQNTEPDHSIDMIMGIATPPPSANCVMLRPNRLGPNGDVEFGRVPGPPRTRA